MDKKEQISEIVRHRIFSRAAHTMRLNICEHISLMNAMYDLASPELNWETFNSLLDAINHLSEALERVCCEPDKARISTEKINQLAYGYILEDEEDEILREAYPAKRSV